MPAGCLAELPWRGIAGAGLPENKGEVVRRHREAQAHEGTSRFCLVQCVGVAREGVEDGQALGDHDGCVIADGRSQG